MRDALPRTSRSIPLKRRWANRAAAHTGCAGIPCAAACLFRVYGSDDSHPLGEVPAGAGASRLSLRSPPTQYLRDQYLRCRVQPLATLLARRLATEAGDTPALCTPRR